MSVTTDCAEEIPSPERARVLLDLAESHDNSASVSLRHAAREVLGLGECEPRQGCFFCRRYCPACGAPEGYPPAGPCENHGTPEARTVEVAS